MLATQTRVHIGEAPLERVRIFRPAGALGPLKSGGQRAARAVRPTRSPEYGRDVGRSERAALSAALWGRVEKWRTARCARSSPYAFAGVRGRDVGRSERAALSTALWGRVEK